MRTGNSYTMLLLEPLPQLNDDLAACEGTAEREEYPDFR